MARRTRTGSRRYLRRRIVAVVLAFAVLLLLGVAADALVYWGRVHPGISVAGLDLGGMKKAQAVERLTELAEASLTESVTLVSGDRSWPVQPSLFGTQIMEEATIAEAMALTRNRGFFGNASSRLRLYFSHHNVDLQGSVNAESMDAFIADVADQLDDPPVNASLEFQGSAVKVREGEPGLVVDRDALRATLTSTLLSLHATEIQIAMVQAQPAVHAADAAKAVEEAQVMIAAPVLLAYGEKKWKLTGEEVQALVDCVVENSEGAAELVPVISVTKAEAFLDAVAAEVNQEMGNATWDTDGQTATLLDAYSGIELDRAKTALALTKAAKATTNRMAQAVTVEVKPERTTEQAQEMGVVSALGRFMTEFEGSENRVSNIQRAAELISDTLLAPGEEFSFNQVVGERTEVRGFHQAKVVAADGTLQDDLGGGICQVATTLFNAAFTAGLDITERKNHSLYFESYPKGRDAAVSWDGPDLRFVNDTDHWLLIRAATTNKSVLFVLYGTPDGRVVDYTTSDWYGVEPQGVKTEPTSELPVGQTRVKDYGQDGRSCTVTRVVKNASGAVLHEDVFESRYPMYFKIIEEGTKTS